MIKRYGGTSVNKNIKLLIIITVLTAFVLVILVAYFYPHYKLLNYVKNGDAEGAKTYYSEHISGNERKDRKYKDIFSEKLDVILHEFTDSKMDFETAEKQAKVIKELNILQKANEVYDRIIIINNDRIAMAAGEKAEQSGDYKSAVLEYLKVKEDSSFLRTKLDNAIKKYKEKFDKEIDDAFSNGEYEKSKELFQELKDVLPDDIKFYSLQEQKIIDLLQNKIDTNDPDDGFKAFENMAAFIRDKSIYNMYADMLSESMAWKEYAEVKEKARKFMVGKWRRSDGGELDGMVVECNGVETTAVGKIVYVPDTSTGFEVGDEKWVSMYVKDENTVAIFDMRTFGSSAKYYSATAKFNRGNNTIEVSYDWSSGLAGNQKQLWTRVK